MNQRLKFAGWALTSAALLALSACGSGGSDTPTATTASVPVTVIDGAIRNALVCLDKNSNGACDAGEPSGRTDAAGNVNLQVSPDDVGKYPVLAIVGTDAVDADHGPVTIPFTMQAPADKPAVVSPLTTLVQTVIENTGVSSADAEAAVKLQTGLNVSLFQDFTKSTTPEAQTAGTVARMVVVVTQQQNNAVQGAVGTTALDNTTITKADLDAAVQRKLLELLPNLLTALTDPSVTNAADAAAKEAALLAAASNIVTSNGLTTSSVGTVVAINNQASGSGGTTTEPPVANASLAGLNYSNLSNWFIRAFTSSLAQNTPDASGNTKYVERRARRSSNGPVARWNTGSDPSRQADLHYNGTAWVTCGFNQESIGYPRDASGNSYYEYCDKLDTGRQQRATFDVAGRTMLSVYQQIRDAGYTNLSIASASSALGSATFPTGSRLLYQTNTPLTTAFAYYPGTGNVVFQADADAAAGKTSPSDNTARCASITGSTPSSSYTAAAPTLESMASRAPGTPCVYGTSTIVITTNSGTATVSSGPRNEWWGATTQSVGVLGTATTGGIQSGYFTTNTLLRVAFGAGNVVKYYACQQRSTDGSPRNCNLAGTGTYSIVTQGDARVMTLANQPAQFSALSYQRVFVERGGRVYFGYQNRTNVNASARLNLTGANALLTQLGLSTINPETSLALTTTSYAGDWRLTSGDGGFTTVSIRNDGSVTCTWNDPDGSSGTDECSYTFSDPATGAVSITFPDGVFTGNFGFLNGTVSSGSFAPTDGDAVSVTGSRR